MNAIVKSISDLLKIITDTFRLPSLFPVLFFLILNRAYILPHLEYIPPFDEVINAESLDQPLAFGLIALLLGYTISAIEIPIVRLYEGYFWWDSWLGRSRTDSYQKRFTELKGKLSRLNKDLFGEKKKKRSAQNQEIIASLDTEIKKCRAEIKCLFPRDLDSILPTKLGNIISAFEAYPWEKYNMDGVTFWPRMLPILDKEGYLDYVNQARATLDFLLNSSLLMTVFGLECILLRIFFVPDISWLLPFGSMVLAWILYRASISSAHVWAAFFKTAFDLFRYHLANALGLQVQDSFIAEMEQWKTLNEFWNDQRKAQNFTQFNHSSESWPVDTRQQENTSNDQETQNETPGEQEKEDKQ